MIAFPRRAVEHRHRVCRYHLVIKSREQTKGKITGCHLRLYPSSHRALAYFAHLARLVDPASAQHTGYTKCPR